MKQIIFTKQDDKKGYPFFQLSSFKAWLVYQDGNKRCRLSIETGISVHQLLTGHVTELILNKEVGYHMLCAMVERHGKYLKKAHIYSTKNNILHRQFINNEWTNIVDPDFSKPHWKDQKIEFTKNQNQIIILK
jgi:hypothetical protein